MTIIAPARPASDPVAPPRAGRRAWLGLAVLFLPTVLVAVDNTVLGFAVPAISTALAPTNAELLWMVDVYPLVLAALLVAMGTLGDRLGRRRLLTIGIAGFGAVSLAATFATDALALVAARALLGFFGAMLMPTTLALLRTLFADRAQRRLAVAIWATGFAAGAAMGPIVGGLLLEHFWWGSIFLVNVPVAVLVLAMLPVLPSAERRRVAPGRVDLLGVALSMLALGPLVLAIKLAAGGAAAAAASAALLGVGSAVLFVRRAGARKRAGAEPALDLDLFASPVLRIAALANATTMFALTGLLFFSAQYLQVVLGLGPLAAGLVLVPGFVTTMGAGLVAARLAGRFPLRVLVPAGLGLAVAGYLLCTGLGPTSPTGVVLAAAVLVGAGIGMSETVANDAILAAAPPDRAGAASAVSETAYEVGAVLGTALLGSVLGAVYRATLDVPAGLGPRAAAGARETVGGAAGVAHRLTGPTADTLLAAAREAYAAAVGVTAAVGAVTVTLVALLVVIGLKGRGRAA